MTMTNTLNNRRQSAAVTVASSWYSNPLANNNNNNNPDTDATDAHRRTSRAFLGSGTMSLSGQGGLNSNNSSQFFDDVDGGEAAAGMKQLEQYSNLSAKLYTDRTFFLAGRTAVSGHMDVTSRSSRVKINSMKVEMVGYEQVKDMSGHNGYSRRYLFKRTVILQGPGTPPTDAVQATKGCDAHHYWTARKGTTRFRFAFDMDADLPSTVYNKLGCIRYQIVGIVGMRDSAEPFSLRTVKEVLVYGSHDMVTAPGERGVEEVQTDRHIWGHFGGKGSVELQCDLDKPVYCSGGHAYVTTRILNDSNKKVKVLKLTLIERIKTFRKLDSGRLEPIGFKRQELASREFRGKDWAFDCDNFREVVLDFPLPDVRSVRHPSAQLLEISFVMQVTVTSSWSKQLLVELPFDIYHASNLNTPPKLAVARRLSEATEAESFLSQSAENEHHQHNTVPRSLIKKQPPDSAFQSEVSMQALNEDYEAPTAPPRNASTNQEYVDELDKLVIPLSSDLDEEMLPAPVVPRIPASAKNSAPASMTVQEFDDEDTDTELSCIEPATIPELPPNPPPEVPSRAARARSHFSTLPSGASSKEFRPVDSPPDKFTHSLPPVNADDSFCVATSIDNMFEKLRAHEHE